MNTATITVAFINPPKPTKKNATIKDTTEKLWLLPIPNMPEYSVGGTYEITYETFDFKGTVFSSIKSGKQVGLGSGGVSSTATAASVPVGKWAEDPKKSKQIAVLSMLKMWEGKIPVGDLAGVVHAINTLDKAYDMTFFGGKKLPSKIESGSQHDMDGDDIPESFR
jgi:hypothetical protein